MINRSSVTFNDSRCNLRVKDNKRVIWQKVDSHEKGFGRVRNISSTGMLLETDRAFLAEDDDVLSFDASLGHNNYIPQNGKLVWQKRSSKTGNRYLSGIHFVDPTDFVLPRLRERIKNGVFRIVHIERAVRVFGKFLLGGLVVLLGFVLWESRDVYKNLSLSTLQFSKISQEQSNLTQSYAYRLDATELKLQSVTNELESVKALYNESQMMLGVVSEDLEQSKQILAQTENMLSQARAEIERLKNTNVALNQAAPSINNKAIASNNHSIAQLQETVAELERVRSTMQANINELDLKNKALSTEMIQLKKELYFYEGNVDNMAEAKRFKKVYRERMKIVKKRIKTFKKDARVARRLAEAERDRIKSQLGNNGYIFANGKSVQVDYEKYNQADSIVEQKIRVHVPEEVSDEPQVEAQPSRKARVDVKVFQ